MTNRDELLTQIQAKLQKGHHFAAKRILSKAIDEEVAASREAANIMLHDMSERNARNVEQLNMLRSRQAEVSARANQAEAQIKLAGESFKQTMKEMLGDLVRERERMHDERLAWRRERKLRSKPRKATRK